MAIEVDRRRAERVATAALCEHGVPEEHAALVAEVLVEADACGKHSHGLLRLPRVVRGIECGNVEPSAEPTVRSEVPGVATVDGGAQLGPVVATRAMAEATAMADAAGVGVVGVHDSNHLGRLGHYTDAARREGYVALAMTNTEPAMPPYGGVEPVLGTNPIAVGLPTEPPFNLDMSTAAISRGDVLHARETGEDLPAGVALDAEGEPTTDPAAALEGTLLPFGGPKGSGLAVTVEVLAGGLVGAAMGRDVTGTYHTERPCTKGDLFVAIDPSAFGGTAFTEAASAFLRDLKRTETADGFDEIRLPGERSVRLSDADRIAVDGDVWAEVEAIGPTD